ncbi:hypothetical protein PRUPE_5G022800 [Prunus persica]|uniref:NmrA-like domain-containing protein n=1 Tax=Prunus persica TaxID=3760 RepID=A0A251P2G5_PRUPE|nr:isoflavone reductase homolog isoform X2 [Prunus persica]ONI05753.1 hypothetical protein PRUPE_5G022800 [Prunus persica]
MGKSKVLVVGGTGYMGRRIVKASLAQGHPTYVLQRPEIGLDIDKLQMLLAFKKQGAYLVEGSFSDFQSLVDAVKLVDVVICTMSGVHFRSHNILLQLKLVKAIKEAGNIKRFFPSEFGLDPARYFAGNLSQMGTLLPPREKVLIYGDGNSKVTIVDEDDLATYTIKTIDDPRTLNKTLYFRPPENVLTQKQLVDMWENLIGKKLEHITISQQDFLASMKGMDYAGQVGVGHFYHIFYEGALTNFEIGNEGEEASKLYPEVKYTRMNEYLKIYA